MTGWTQIEIAAGGEAEAELVLAFAGKDGQVRLTGGAARLSAAVRGAGFEAKAGRWLDVLPASPSATRKLVLGAQAGQASGARWLDLGGCLIEAMTALRVASVRLPPAKAFGAAGPLEGVLLGALLHSFRPRSGRTTPDPAFRPARLVIAPADEASAAGALRTAQAVNLARAWVEAPANRLNPTTWAEEARGLARPGLSARVLGRQELESLGAHAILAVGRGAEHGPNLALLEWRGAPAREGWDAVVVGKGLTFDGGGLNLKPSTMIAKMKFDMGGGAAALGAVILAASREARCNVAAVVPMVENAIDALSYRPGDVIGSLAGLTIEVLNTDAEGRLVLADGVTYGVRTYQPDFIVDIATLTSAITGVLHEEFAGLYANDDQLAGDLAAAGEATGEHLWRMPLAASQDYLVESAEADVANLGAPGFLGAGMGSPAAGAKLIQKFAGEARWAHLDIAGTAWASRRTALGGEGATGFGVRLLDQWFRRFE